MAKTARTDELSGKEAIRDAFIKVVADVEKGVTDQQERTDDIVDHWDIYNCIYGGKQFYNGNSQVYISIVADAVDARKTRFVNQIFPQSQRCVEVTSENEDLPMGETAMIEHYIRRAKLRTEIIPALSISGDIEGQYSLYCGWKETKRRNVERVMKHPEVDGVEHPDLGATEDLEEIEYTEGEPDIDVISDPDLIVLPATANSIEDAIDQGGSVTILRRWRKARIRKLIADDDITKKEGEALIKSMQKGDENSRVNIGKKLARHAGIKAGGDYALIYEIWTNLKVDGEWRLCRGYAGAEKQVLGIKLCPYWCEKVPVISAPVNKEPNVFKGRAPVKKVADFQYAANDVLNEGLDTGHFSAMPIIMTDPEKNPRVSTMILGLASVWETSPQDTQFAKFPDLWKDCLVRVGSIKDQVFQSLGVNPSMVPGMTGQPGKKRNQAEVAQEQQVDILTTSDAVTGIEEGILTPLVQRIAEYDYQFRDKDLTVRMFGDMGKRAMMQQVPPIQSNRRFEYRWFGVEAARNAAQIQQQIAGINVIKGLPPQAYAGYRLNLAPLVIQIAENMFGPRLAPQVFVSIKDDMTVPPEQENELMEHGFDAQVHPGDQDPQHMQVHMQAMQATGDPHGVIRVHIQKHVAQMQAKAQAAAQMQQQGQGQPPQGGPQPGAQPGTVRGMKGPPGAIHRDQMPAAGAVSEMPRKTGTGNG